MPPKSKKSAPAKAKKDIKKDVAKKMKKVTKKDTAKRKEGIKAKAVVVKEVSKKAGKKPEQEKPKQKKEKKVVAFKKQHASLFVSRPKHYGMGQDYKPVKDLRRFVRWPTYIKRQRQKAILKQRLKVPPAVNQFKAVLDRMTRKRLLQMIRQYRPYPKYIRRNMIKLLAAKKLKDPKQPPPAKKLKVAVGIHKVTPLIEQKKASLVVIACDVDPLELVVWVPGLCRKLNVPFCIVQNSALLGKYLNLKRVTCVAFTKIQPKHKARFDKILEAIKVRYNPKYETAHKHWGGLELGRRHTIKTEKRQAALASAAGRTVAKK